MDSVTQAALGAVISQAGLGKKLGRKAALWGAICGTLPDLDVLVPLGDPITDYAYHRSASHSLFMLTLAAPLVTALMMRIHRIPREWLWQCLLVIWLALITHPLLDSLTIYGTQLFWPLFIWPPVSISSVFIVDLMYTIPLLAGLIFTLVRPGSVRVPGFALTVSSLYLLFGLVSKPVLEREVEAQLQQQGIAYSRIVTTPTPLSLDWRIVVMGQDQQVFYEGFRSVLDTDSTRFDPYTTQPDLLASVQQNYHVRLMQWFTRGFYKVTRNGADVVMTDLRMGIEPYYVFSFVVARVAPDGTITPVLPERLPSEMGSLAGRVLGE